MFFEQNIMMDESRQSSYQQQEELAQRRVEEAAPRCCRGSSTTTTSSPSSSSSSSPFEYRETSRYEEKKMMVDDAPQSSSTEEAAAMECYDGRGSGQQHTTMQHSSSPIKRTIASSKNSKKKTTPYKLSEKDIFLYKLYNVLSTPSTTSSSSSSVEGDPQSSTSVQNQQYSTVLQPQASTPTNNNHEQPPRNPDIITWLPHGHGFTILQKTSFEKYILGYIIPNVKYASFVRRLKRYKFLRISSGPEMGAYYHPNFKRGQPNLLNLINTTDEIPIDKYGVDVNMAVALSYNGGGRGGGGRGGGGGATTSLPSNDDPTRTTTTTTAAASTTAAPFPSPHVANNNDDDDASLLSLGTITPGGSIQGLTPSTTRGSRSSGRRKQRVGVEEDAALIFDDLLLPFLDDVDNDDNNDGNGDAAAIPPPELDPPELEVSTTDFDSLQSSPLLPSKHTAALAGRVGNAVTSTSSSSSSSPQKNVDICTTSRIPPPPGSGDIYAVQQQMLQQEQMLMLQQEQWQQDQLLLQQQHQARFQQQPMPMMQPHPSIVSPISPIRQAVTVSCLNNGNVGSNSIVNNAGSTTKSNSTKGVTVAKDMKSFPQMLRDISRQKRLRHMAQKKQQEQRSSTPPSSYSISSCFSNTTVINVPTSSMGGGGGMNIKKMFQYRRMGSAPDSLQTSFNPTMRQTGMKRSQYRRRGSNDGMMSYVKKASSSKYQYDRKGSADSMTFHHRKGSSNYSRKSSYRRNNSCDAISSVFNTSQDHRMDVEVEEQPYFVSMDCNEELEELRRQHHHQHSNEEKLRRHRNHIRKDPYEELWRQVDEGSGGFQYQHRVSTTSPTIPNNVPDVPRSDHLDLEYADYYKPVVGADQHDDGHDYQKIAETLIMASDDEGDCHEEEQQTYLPHGMRYDRQQGTHGNDCDDYEPLPIEKKFPRYSRRCTL